MSRYKAYPKYTPSETELVDELPVGWRTLRGKYVFSEYSERSEAGEEQLLSVSEYYGVKPRGEVIEEGDFLSRAESLAGYKKCQKNDLVMNIMLAWKCGLGVSKYDGIVSPAYSVFRFNGNAIPDYMHYLLRTETYTGHFKTRSTGVIDSRLRLYPESFGDVSIILPPAGEQEKIVAFLNHETAKIDALIEKQQRLIELLKEKRQAVISHAVTKGLNPEAPMKDSGVEWLGEVPTHWTLGKCGFYVSILSGYAFQSSGFSDSEADIKLLRGINVGVSYLKWDEVVYWKRTSWDGLDIYEMKAGDIVIGMDRPLISEGIRVAKVKATDLPCLLLQRVASIKANESLDADYLLKFLSSSMFAAHFTPDTTGVSVPHISPDQIGNFVVPIPPIDEQKQIVMFVDRNSRKLNELIDKAETAIALMQERRTALISTAVTGKIDVRDWQPVAIQNKAGIEC